MKSFYKTFYFASLPLICFFLISLVELMLRFIFTGTLYLKEINPHFRDIQGVVRLAPSQNIWWYGCNYSINSSGFRMPHEVDMKAKIKIVALGDSVTLGMGVQNTADVWPNKLKSLIKNDYPCSSVEVVNTGIQGWNLLNRENGILKSAEFVPFVASLKEKLNDVSMVIYCVCLNDIPSRTSQLFEINNEQNKKRFNYFPEKYREWLKRKFIYRLSRDAFREIRFNKLDFSQILTSAEEPNFWNDVEKEIKMLKSKCSNQNANLFVILCPFSYQFLPQNSDLFLINEKWANVCLKNKIAFIDLSSNIDKKNVLSYYALGDYIHFNKKGHNLIAEKAFDLIRFELERKIIEFE